MAKYLGPGVSRTLDSLNRMFKGVVFQKSKPPLDSEFNVSADLHNESLRQLIASQMPSGFLGDPPRALEEYLVNPNWTNLFSFGNPRNPVGAHETQELQPVVIANVNGWIIPVAGTEVSVDGDVRNFIKLFPPPLTGSRIDYIFLEAWQTLVAPNPSTVNKPSASTLWKYGNVQHGGTNIVDDLEDPTIGFETTKRIQVQYRIRVYGQTVSGVALDVYPDGLDDPNLLGQGTATTPVGGLQFTNMREELGDPSLWRSGDGDPLNGLGTIDGYTYAIPICAVFRRNSGTYVSVENAGNPNQNGAFLRTPGNTYLPLPAQGARELTTVTLTTYLNPSYTGDITVLGLVGSGIDDTYHTWASTFLVIDNEIVGVSAVDTGTSKITLASRGRYGSAATGHQIGATVKLFNIRPDGLYADQVTTQDILDLRRSVNPGDWDYQRLLNHSVGALVRGELRTAWKQAGTGSTEGVSIHEVDYLQADGPGHPNQTEALDGPDGIRQIWSDAAVKQADVTVLLDDEATLVNNFTASQFDTNSTWGIGADFYPTGYVNLGGYFPNQPWTNGSSVFLHIGGNTGSEGARGTFRDGADREVRFITPKEYFHSPSPDTTKGNQYPITLRFLEERALETPPPASPLYDPAADKNFYPGPMYPWEGRNFEQPFIVLGQVVNPNLKVTADPATFVASTTVPLTGTISYAGLYIIGTGTFFTKELVPGDLIRASGIVVRVSSIESDTSLTVCVKPGLPMSGSFSRVLYYTLDIGVNFSTPGTWYSITNNVSTLDPTQVLNPLLNVRKTLYGMLTNEGKDPSGSSSELYAVTYGDPDSLGNNGAWKIIGVGAGPTTYVFPFTTVWPGATRLALVPLSADFLGVDTGTGNTLSVEVRSMEHLAELDGSYADGSPDLCIVATDLGGDISGSPWYRSRLYSPSTGENLTMPRYPSDWPTFDIYPTSRVAIQSKLLLSLSLLYHPSRGGMARIPDEVVKVTLRNANSSYLRQNKTSTDPLFPLAPDNETLYDPVQTQLWNRLAALGLPAPIAPNYGGNIVGYTEQDREHEIFFDKGSKTLVVRPFRDRSLTLQSLTMDELASIGQSLLGDSYAYPDTHPKDNLQLFTRTGINPSTGKTMGFAVPREIMPRFGRQDIPYYTDIAAGTGTFLAGINHLFKDTSDDTDPVFNIIGGRDNTTGGNQVTSMFFRTSNPTAYGHGLSGTNITPTVVASFFEARKTTSINTALPYALDIVNRLRAVNSSDLGKGLKGIQLPPYYGVARVYGVYDARDYQTKGGRTFLADRATLESDPTPNLLRTDAAQQTLFIFQDGAKDLTLQDNDHTYIIPSEALDLTKALGYVPGDRFEDYDYIVECVVFGFARGWINENNYVLVRCHNGAGKGALGGAINQDGEIIQLEGVPMVVPSAASYNDALYVAHNRTVYQGDPYMTRDQISRTVSDYTFRYGRPDPTDLFQLKTPIQQYKTDGTFVPTTPNARAFEVLASLDFHTTLGTGNVAGDLYPGTFTDSGFLEPSAATRIPNSLTSPPWRVLTRAFTEGQKRNPSRAQAIVDIADNGGLNPDPTPGDTHAYIEITTLTGARVALAFYTPEALALDPTGLFLTYLGGDPNHGIVMVDGAWETSSEIHEITATFGGGVMNPGEVATIDATTLFSINADFGDLVTIYPKDQTPGTFSGPKNGGIVFDGWVQDVVGVPKVILRAIHTGYRPTFSPDFTITGSLAHPSFSLGVGVGTAVNIPCPGAVVGDVAVWNFVEGFDLMTDLPFQVTAGVRLPGLVTLDFFVPYGNAVMAPGFTLFTWPAGTFYVAVLRETALGDYQKPFSAKEFYVQILKKRGSAEQTTNNLVSTINTHPDLVGVVQAFKLSGSETVIEALTPGAEGNNLHIKTQEPVGYPTRQGVGVLYVRTPLGALHEKLTSSPFKEGTDQPFNGGNGTTQLQLTGMTERLPLGILLQDSDFLGENPLGDTSSAFKIVSAGYQPQQTMLPLTLGGDEFSRFLGVPGELLGTADGALLQYVPFNESSAPTGATTLRIYRGGGSAFVLSGLNPGGPLEWVTSSFPSSLQPVLKGGALAGRAFLVRNSYEEAFGAPATVSNGDEIQLVIVTYGVIGDGRTQEEGITLSGLISPTGYGEGYAAADRYRITGRPMFKGNSRQMINPADVVLAPYPEELRPSAPVFPPCPVCP